MRRIRAAAIACILLAPLPALAVTIDTVLVGNPGNVNDSTGFGSVNYAYRIGATEVTIAQYVEFLNAKAISNLRGLYKFGMFGITQDGRDGSFTYTVTGNMGDKPVTGVSWYSAIRFTNWLHNGQGNGSTEVGAYTLGRLQFGGNPYEEVSISRNSSAQWFLPNENEWYKAAYYQPANQGGDSDNYWLYPTMSNSAPTLARANSVGDIINPGSNVANYSNGAAWAGCNCGFLTTVGSAGSASQSFYGTSDQGGNVYEWNETLIAELSREVRGGSWNGPVDQLASSSRLGTVPTASGGLIGFRVATNIGVPEPSTLALVSLGALGVLIAARHRKR